MAEAVDELWPRALLAASHGRGDLAIELLRRLLGSDPGHAPAHALLAQLLVERGEDAAALAAAQRAVGLQPDLPFAHHVLAIVHCRRDELDPAQAAIERARALDPDDADLCAQAAQIAAAKKEWPRALAFADQGLQLDGAHVGCLNLRSLALVQLGRRDEANATMADALARDPDNAYTHQAHGWALLRQGEAAKALVHFQEALRRDATLDGARAGLVEALKARNPLYRAVLGWFLWFDRFGKGRQQEILLGAWLAVFFGRRILADNGYASASSALGLVWLAVVLLTACTVPLFNLLLLLHPLGRHALDRRSRNDAIALGGVVVALLGMLAFAWGSTWLWADEARWFLLFLLMPVAGLGAVGDGWPRRALQLFSIAMVGWFLWWSWVAIDLQSVLEQGVGPGKFRTDDPRVSGLTAHLEQLWSMIVVLALSSWFVLLAPRGRRRRAAR